MRQDAYYRRTEDRSADKLSGANDRRLRMFCGRRLFLGFRFSGGVSNGECYSPS